MGLLVVFCCFFFSQVCWDFIKADHSKVFEKFHRIAKIGV